MASSRRHGARARVGRARRRLRRRSAARATLRASKLARAERSLQAELEAAVDHLGMAAEPGERVAPTRCDDGTRQDVTSGYRIRLRFAGDQEQMPAAGRRLLAPAWPPRARGRPPRRASRRSSRPPIRAGRSRSSSSRSAARRCSPAARPACPTRSPDRPADTLGRVDERALAERLITYDTSSIDGLRAAAGFVKGWLEAREIDVEDHDFDGLPVLTADVGPRDAPDARPPRPPRRRARPPGAVHAARRGRPADRPRRLRHEGRARRDDVRAARRRRQHARARALRVRARRGVRGHRHALDRRARAPGLRRRLRDHRRADRPARRRPGQGRAGDAGSWSTAAPRTARRRGSATTRC